MLKKGWKQAPKLLKHFIRCYPPPPPPSSALPGSTVRVITFTSFPSLLLHKNVQVGLRIHGSGSGSESNIYRSATLSSTVIKCTNRLDYTAESSVADPKQKFRILFRIRIRPEVSFGSGSGFGSGFESGFQSGFESRIRIRVWILDPDLDQKLAKFFLAKNGNLWGSHTYMHIVCV